MFVALLIIIFTCLLSVSLYLCLSRKQVATKQGKFVFLRVNNEPIRNTIRAAGINLCPCCRAFRTITSLPILKALWYVVSTSLGITSSRRQRNINMRLSTAAIMCLCSSLRFYNSTLLVLRNNKKLAYGKKDRRNL